MPDFFAPALEQVQQLWAELVTRWGHDLEECEYEEGNPDTRCTCGLEALILKVEAARTAVENLRTYHAGLEQHYQAANRLAGQLNDALDEFGVPYYDDDRQPLDLPGRVRLLGQRWAELGRHLENLVDLIGAGRPGGRLAPLADGETVEVKPGRAAHFNAARLVATRAPAGRIEPDYAGQFQAARQAAARNGNGRGRK